MIEVATRMPPECPNCGKLLPIGKFAWGRGRPFACSRCGQQLIVPKVAGVPVTSIFIVLLLFLKSTPPLKDNYPLVMGLLAVAAVFEYFFFTSVRRA
jgi:hypothetical protein